MQKNELISIIVPVYNVEKYIEKCINSITNQTYKKIEIILIDDGSTDGSGKMCDEYALMDKRVKVIHKENAGVSSARNLGINMANGEWISFVDADDWLDSDFCEKLYNEAITNEKLDIISSGYNRVYSTKQEKINCKIERIKYSAQEYFIKLLNVQNGYGFCHMKLIRRECIKDIKFHEDIEVGEDALFNMELVKNIREVLILGQALYNYRFNNNSLVRKYDDRYVEKYLKSMMAVKKYIFNNYTDNLQVKYNYYNYVTYHVLLIVVNYCFNKKNNQTFMNQIKLLKKVCNIEDFKEAIKKSNYKDLSITRSITLFTIKYKLYFFTALICMYRQYQFNR